MKMLLGLYRQLAFRRSTFAVPSSSRLSPSPLQSSARVLSSTVRASSRPFSHFQISPRTPNFSSSRLQHLNTGARRCYARPTYRNFGNSRNPFTTIGISSRTFQKGIYILAGGSVIFVALNIERVPGSGRLRFNFVSPDLEARLSSGQYEQMRQQFSRGILPQSAPEVKRVRRVLDHLLPYSGLEPTASRARWTVDVVQSKEANAFVMPGGHVFVFTGILPICSDDDGLATVLGHEIAHAVAHHPAEQMSRFSVLILAALAFSVLYDVSNNLTWYVLDLALNRPGSRAQEAEADHLGLLMMARSCFDPQRAVTFWKDMQRMEANSTKPPQWMSTHPSGESRIKNIEGWISEALDARDASTCGALSSYADQFRSKIRGNGSDDGFWKG